MVLLLGEKNGGLTPSHELRIINLDNANELNKDILNVPFEEISAYKSDKWTKFFLSTEQRNFYENSLNKTSVNSFNDYIKGEIGITTGNNSFFVINNDTANEYSLGEYTLPILGRSVETKGILYKQDDIAKNIEKGKKYLVT
ncbi:Modification methylase Eco57IB [Listeria booriae]|nr:Modification methylase Eco57IB [Listeria booriae]